MEVYLLASHTIEEFNMNQRRRMRHLGIFVGGEAIFYTILRITSIPNALVLTTAIGNFVAFYFVIIRDYRDSGKVK